MLSNKEKIKDYSWQAESSSNVNIPECKPSPQKNHRIMHFPGRIHNVEGSFAPFSFE
jgi:predicted fused transcriptional regulator/phosphomethylpyrimidine kinase